MTRRNIFQDPLRWRTILTPSSLLSPMRNWISMILVSRDGSPRKKTWSGTVATPPSIFKLQVVSAMHRVGSAGNTSNSIYPRKEKRLTYVLSDVYGIAFFWFLCLQHCFGINFLAVLKSSVLGSDYLFTVGRDGTLERWALADDAPTCSTTFESHVDWGLGVN